MEIYYKYIKGVFLVVASFLISINVANAIGTLQGLAKLSCEAIICLSTGSPPNECNPSLNYFYSLTDRDPRDQIRMRKNFLDICPESGSMGNYTSVLANGAGRCDRDFLLTELNPKYDFDGNVVSQNKTIPQYCDMFYNHQWTRLGLLPQKINPPGKCYDNVGCQGNYWWNSPDISVGGLCYKMINKPGFMEDLGRGVECLDLWQ